MKKKRKKKESIFSFWTFDTKEKHIIIRSRKRVIIEKGNGQLFFLLLPEDVGF